VSIDSKSLYHEAKAAGMIYQATLRYLLHAERSTVRQSSRRTVIPEPGAGSAMAIGIGRI
jgi:hypothetical protein